MTRGRKSTTGVDEAIEIAGTRGTVMRFCPENEMASDFLIRNFSHIVFVRVKRSPRSRCSLAGIEAGFPEPIASLREILLVAGVLCELWTYTKNGTWRFFRIQKAGLLEIDRQGNPLDRPVREQDVSGNTLGSVRSRGKPGGKGETSDDGLTEKRDPPSSGSQCLPDIAIPDSPSEGIQPETGPEYKNGTNSQKSGTK